MSVVVQCEYERANLYTLFNYHLIIAIHKVVISFYYWAKGEVSYLHLMTYKCLLDKQLFKILSSFPCRNFLCRMFDISGY